MVPQLDDKIKKWVRTAWPLLIGHIAAYLVAMVAHSTGLQISSAVAFEVIGVAMTLLVAGVGSWLEHRTGDSLLARVARMAGQWLMSVGLPIGPPTYNAQSSTPSRE